MTNLEKLKVVNMYNEEIEKAQAVIKTESEG